MEARIFVPQQSSASSSSKLPSLRSTTSTMSSSVHNASSHYMTTKDWSIERKEIENQVISSKNIFSMVQGDHVPVNTNHPHYKYAETFLEGYYFPKNATNFMVLWRPREWDLVAEAILLAIRMGKIRDAMPFQLFLASTYCSERVVHCCSRCGLPYGLWCGE